MSCPNSSCTAFDWTVSLSSCDTSSHHTVTPLWAQPKFCEGGLTLPPPRRVACDHLPHDSDAGKIVRMLSISSAASILLLLLLFGLRLARREPVMLKTQPLISCIFLACAAALALSPLALLGDAAHVPDLCHARLQMPARRLPAKLPGLLSRRLTPLGASLPLDANRAGVNDDFACRARPWAWHVPFVAMWGSLFMRVRKLYRFVDNKQLRSASLLNTRPEVQLLQVCHAKVPRAACTPTLSLHRPRATSCRGDPLPRAPRYVRISRVHGVGLTPRPRPRIRRYATPARTRTDGP